jgi:mono/diheme cytochrome c family protein
MKTMSYLKLGIVIFAFFLTGCGGGGNGGDQATGSSESGGDQASTQLINQGEKIFSGKGLCSNCHGADATGTQLAPDLTDEEWVNIETPVTRDKVISLVKSGVAQPVEHNAPMPPMGGASLNDEELEAVSAYVVSLSQ